MPYLDVVKCFADNNCELLTTEEEYNNLIKQNVKYKYIASCGHTHEVFYNVYRNRKSGVICPSCTIVKNQKTAKEKAVGNPTVNLDMEYNNIVYFMDILKDNYDVKFIGSSIFFLFF